MEAAHVLVGCRSDRRPVEAAHVLVGCRSVVICDQWKLHMSLWGVDLIGDRWKLHMSLWGVDLWL